MLIEMDFRTWRSNGVILSVDNNRMDGLAIEIVNGSVSNLSFWRISPKSEAFQLAILGHYDFQLERKI